MLPQKAELWIEYFQRWKCKQQGIWTIAITYMNKMYMKKSDIYIVFIKDVMHRV